MCQNVGLGTQEAPVRIVFKSGSDESKIDIRLSGVNSTVDTMPDGSLFFGGLGTTFDEAFSFNDPKLQWKGIRKKYWDIIEHGQVKAGMSEDECTLSWGSPKDVKTTNSGHRVDEQWVYGTSSYLYFTDGVLTTIEN